MRYPVKLEPAEEGGFVVTFPDVPEAITQGEDEDDAMLQAAEALETALDFYLDENRIVPLPSRIKRGYKFVELPTSLAAKILLLNEMNAQKVRPVELARRLSVTPQEVNRLVNIHHTSKIDSIAGALRALGKVLDVRAV